MEDPKVNQLVSQGACLGCFYVESPAMRMLLKKLEVNTYLGLVAASSIIRPGVAKSGMMREYILRHKNPERRKQAHPVLAKIMPETYGIMVYQEDVIKVAHHFAGLDLGEADVLRRGMSGKYRSRKEFQAVKQKFIDNCRAKGYEDEVTFKVWREVESFAGYAFAKGHSASYAVESYQSLFLKTYYPLEYMVAVLNNGGGFYRNECYIHEAKMLGAEIKAPCINRSKWKTIINDKTIILGFQHISNLERQTVINILEARRLNGVFQSLHDFLQRVLISQEQLDLLIRVGAFAFTGQSKRELLWYSIFQQKNNSRKVKQRRIFKSIERKFDMPVLNLSEYEHAFDQMEILGFSLKNPFDLVPEEQFKSNICAKHFKQFKNDVIMVYGYLITVKKTSTANGLRMNFGTFIDAEGHWIDTVHFPKVAHRYPFRGKGVYKIIGKVVEEFGFLSLEVSEMEKVPFMDDPRYAEDSADSSKYLVASS
jgi:DNA polymerase-3 subunit alpha